MKSKYALVCQQDSGKGTNPEPGEISARAILYDLL